MLILLITLDCVRADRIYGSFPNVENFKRLQEDSISYFRAYSSSQNTLSSHFSILTSTYLFQHGIYDNFSPASLPQFSLIHRLKESNFSTYSVCGIDFLGRFLGNQSGNPDPAFRGKGDQKTILSRIKRKILGARRNAESVFKIAYKIISRHKKSDNIFLWLHFFDAHMPYEAPASIIERFVSTERSNQSINEQINNANLFSPSFPEYKWHLPITHYPQKYDAAIFYEDQCFGSFIKAIKDKGFYEDSAIIITADHGECMMEHGVYCAHKKLFDATIRVPLIIKQPEGKKKNTQLDFPVHHVDLAPTILEWIGREEANFQGESLNSLKPPKRNYALSEHVNNFMKGIRKDGYIYQEINEDAENKWNMPIESCSLFESDTSKPVVNPEKSEELRILLHKVMDERSAENLQAQGGEVDSETKKQLEALGYL